MRSSRNTIKRK